MELLEGETLAQALGAAAARDVAPLLDIGDPDRRRARVGARQGHRPPRHQAGEHLHQRARPGEDPRLRPREDRRDARQAGGSGAGRTRRASPHDLTTPGTAMGTVAYMSPEQARGQLTDARTDLFSLGHGALPDGDRRRCRFRATRRRSSSTRFSIAIRRRSRRSTAGCPPELGRILDKALEKDRNLRYQTATELKTDLIRLQARSRFGPQARAPTAGDPRSAPAEAGGARRSPCSTSRT